MTDCTPSAQRVRKEETPDADSWSDGAQDEDFKPLSRQEALQWRAQHPQASVWQVVRWQALLCALAPVVAWLLMQQAAPSWSVLYGGFCILLPTALMAYGLTSSSLSRALAKAFPGVARVSLAGVFFWEGIKVLLVLAMLWLAPQVVSDLSWLGLVAGLVVVLKAYWLTFWFGRRQSP